MGKFGITAVAIVVFVIVAWQRSGKDSDAVLNQMKQLVSQLDTYPQNAEYLDRMVEHEHKMSFHDYYDMGGRRRGASFDDEGYLRHLLDKMIANCNRDRREDVAKELMELRENLFSPEET